MGAFWYPPMAALPKPSILIFLGLAAKVLIERHVWLLSTRSIKVELTSRIVWEEARQSKLLKYSNVFLDYYFMTLYKTILVEKNNSSVACIRENAHMHGEKPDAARYDTAFVNSELNLISFCYNCQKNDADISLYPLEDLLSLRVQYLK